jgi:hypothetical protein
VAVTEDVPTGFVVDQVIVVLQLLAPAAIVQEVGEAVIVPVIEGLFSEQFAVEPPFEPLQFQVQVVVLLELFALVPALQL